MKFKTFNTFQKELILVFPDHFKISHITNGGCIAVYCTWIETLPL